MTDELMHRLTLQPLSRDRYECPICLDLIVEPVSLTVCGHRFCWQCLVRSCYEGKTEGNFERCPCCRTAFAMDPDEFEVDGILDRFLRKNFPVDAEELQRERACLKKLLSDAECLSTAPELSSEAIVKKNKPLSKAVSKQKQTLNKCCGPKCIGNICVEPLTFCIDVPCCPDCDESLTGICRHMRIVQSGVPCDANVSREELIRGCLQMTSNPTSHVVASVVELVFN